MEKWGKFQSLGAILKHGHQNCGGWMGGWKDDQSWRTWGVASSPAHSFLGHSKKEREYRLEELSAPYEYFMLMVMRFVVRFRRGDCGKVLRQIDV
ncbi:hypothetical protein AAFF_G00387720 [Aldrovandia affinis]|uniref:Uncharacterized protein n=1 Tax=Aldrovandia affinis TaxID=143900 RepID=A0AAD7WLK2_9TELE|nr:hypothetical protein AAFF_G00387720 [Aldrovandia affinis]